MKRILIGICLSLVLTSCGSPKQELDGILNTSHDQVIFITRDRLYILQGSYKGLSAGVSVNLNTGEDFKFDLDELLEEHPQLMESL